MKPLAVLVTESDSPPVDVDAWARTYVDVLLEVEARDERVVPLARVATRSA